MNKAFTLSDQSQHKSTNLLATRTRDVDQWKGTLERAISAQMEEISLLEEQRQRLKKSLFILQMPDSIGKMEFIYQQFSLLISQFRNASLSHVHIYLKYFIYFLYTGFL